MKKMSTSFILVLALLSIATVAFAAASQWGVLDFITNRGMEGMVLPEASELIQYDSDQQVGKTDLASFSLREAIFDGEQLYMVIAVKPEKDSVLLLGSDALPSDPVMKMGPDYETLSMTIMDYAYKHSKDMLLQTNIYDAEILRGKEGFFQTGETILEADGTLVYMLKGAYKSEQESIAVNLLCSVTPYVDITENDVLDTANTQETELAFVLERADVRNIAASQEAVTFADCGVRVDRVTLSGTAMATHISVEFTVVDEAAYALTDEGLFFEFLDEKGECIPDGVAAGSGVYPVESEEKSERKLLQKASIAAMDELPDAITLRPFNVWEKNRYEAQIIDLILK